MTKRVWIAGASVLLVGMLSTTSSAIIQFQREFLATYVEKNENKEFVKAAKEARCHVCHVGKKRTNRNVYGEQLAELLDKTKDKANKKKIHEALAKVAEMHSDPKDEKSPTFGDLIKQGKLPGGEVQKEDPKE